MAYTITITREIAGEQTVNTYAAPSAEAAETEVQILVKEWGGSRGQYSVVSNSGMSAKLMKLSERCGLIHMAIEASPASS